MLPKESKDWKNRRRRNHDGTVTGIPDMDGMVTGISDVDGMVTGIPDVDGMVTEIPEVDGMVTEIPDVDGMVTEAAVSSGIEMIHAGVVGTPKEILAEMAVAVTVAQAGAAVSQGASIDRRGDEPIRTWQLIPLADLGVGFPITAA